MAIWDTEGQKPRGYLKPCYRYIKDKLGDNLTGAAIGISFGYGEEYVLDSIIFNRFYMIDPYKHFDFSAMTPELWEEQYKYAVNKFSGLGHVTLWRATSEEASKLIEDHSLDFVYIDGNHFYPAVKMDIDLWWPKIKDGGVIGGHDYYDVDQSVNLDELIYDWRVNGIHYGVVKAVRDFARKNNKLVHCAPAETETAYDWWIDK